MLAQYYDGASAVGEAVEVHTLDGCVVVTRWDGSILRWSFHGFRTRSGASGSYLRIEKLPYSGECLVISGTNQIRELARLLPVRAGIDSRRNKLLVVTLLAATLLLGVGFYTLQGLLFYSLASVTPLYLEEKLGSAAQLALAPEDKRLTTAGIERPLTRIVSRLSAAARSPYRFRVVVSRNDEVNAWAAPAGYIGLNCGLIEKLESGDELAAVLAHEFDHVVKRHSTRNLIRTITIRIALSFIGGGGSDGLIDTAGLLGSLHFMRGDEAEADRGGLELLVRANVNPQAMARAFERIERSAPDLPGALRYISSHPPTSERRRVARQVASRSPGTFQPILSDVDYAAFRSACSYP